VVICWVYAIYFIFFLLEQEGSRESIAKAGWL